MHQARPGHAATGGWGYRVALSGLGCVRVSGVWGSGGRGAPTSVAIALFFRELSQVGFLCGGRVVQGLGFMV